MEAERLSGRLVATHHGTLSLVKRTLDQRWVPRQGSALGSISASTAQLTTIYGAPDESTTSGGGDAELPHSGLERPQV